MGPGDQARAWRGRAILLGILATVAACADERRLPDVTGTLTRAFGPAAEGREAPPGLDAPYPNLGTVPERPARPTPGQRQTITDALAAERARAAGPLPPSDFRPPRRTGTEGDRVVPLGPPRPPVLSALPVPAAAMPAPAVTAPPTAAPPAAAPAAPSAPPAMPLPSASAPAPTPSRPEAPPAASMRPGPPPPPPPTLLAPGAGPPPPPAPDLLAPLPRGR